MSEESKGPAQGRARVNGAALLCGQGGGTRLDTRPSGTDNPIIARLPSGVKTQFPPLTEGGHDPKTIP